MVMRWLECSGGSVHIAGPCPNCYASQGGLLMGTVSGAYKGRVTAKCVDCGTVIDYYVDAAEGKIWRMEAVETKAGRVEA